MKLGFGWAGQFWTGTLWDFLQGLILYAKLREKRNVLGVLYLLRRPSTGFQRGYNVRIYLLYFLELG